MFAHLVYQDNLANFMSLPDKKMFADKTQMMKRLVQVMAATMTVKRVVTWKMRYWA
jgi:hypothetical protein